LLLLQADTGTLASWASEVFFPGGGPKVVKFVFYPSKLKKQHLFANNFKIQGE